MRSTLCTRDFFIGYFRSSPPIQPVARAPRHTHGAKAKSRAVMKVGMQGYSTREGILQPAQVGDEPEPLGAQGVAPKDGNR